MKRFYLLVSCIAIVFIPVQNTRVLAQETKKPSRPTLKIVASPTDSIIAISYTVPESSFVNLSISGTVGGVIAIPVYEPRMPGEYTVKLNKKHWPQEVYTISIILNHDRKRRRARRFTHHAPDRQIASDEQLQQVWNQAISSMRFDPETSVKHWETLLENTGYKNRGAAFLYSCGPLLKVADSMRVHAQIDSAVKWVPRSSVYKVIARIMNGQEVPSSYGDVKLYPSTALKYAKKAIASADDIPLPHRRQALFGYYHVLGYSHLAAEKLSDAEIAFQQALSIFGELPEYKTPVKNNWDVSVLKDLGMVKNAQTRLRWRAAIIFRCTCQKPLGYRPLEYASARLHPSAWHGRRVSRICDAPRTKASTKKQGRYTLNYRQEFSRFLIENHRRRNH